MHSKQRLFADSITPKKSFTSFAPHGSRCHQVIEYLEIDARSSERGLGKKKPNEPVVNEKRVNEEKDEEGCAKRGGTMEGATENGMMLCGPRVATHLSFFIQANHLRFEDGAIRTESDISQSVTLCY